MISIALKIITLDLIWSSFSIAKNTYSFKDYKIGISFHFMVVKLCILGLASAVFGHYLGDFMEHAGEHIEISDIMNWLDFELTYSEKLTPVVSLLCAPLDYLELSIVPGWPEQGVVNKLQKSVCSKLPK